MRFNKQKRHRRCVRFYTACFGFRQPFKVLCDGTFIHHLVANRITPHDEAISKALRGSVKLFTTRCVIAELNSLGASHVETLNDANQNFNIARCDHEKRTNAAACISDVIGESNSEHFFVATQDAYLRKKLQKIPAVPALFGLRNTLFLEQPSSSQREFVNSAEEDQRHVSKRELDVLKNRANQIINTDSTEGESVAEELAAVQKKISKDRIDLKDKAQFKKKRAKGPNPLSCKKKKNRVPDSTIQKTDEGSEQTAEGKSRKRKRSRKSKNVAVASSDGS